MRSHGQTKNFDFIIYKFDFILTYKFSAFATAQ